MSAKIHFAPSGEKGLCGNNGKGTCNPDAVTCERCKVLVANESATGADVWCLQGEQDKLISRAQLQDLYTLALKKRYASVQRYRSMLESEETDLWTCLKRAQAFGLAMAPVSGGIKAADPGPTKWRVEWTGADVGSGVEFIEAATGGAARLAFQESHSSLTVTRVRREDE